MGQHLELADQVSAENEWSLKSAEQILDAIKDDQHFGIASVEIAAYVDVGPPLISETSLSEMKLNGVWTVHMKESRTSGSSLRKEFMDLIAVVGSLNWTIRQCQPSKFCTHVV